MWLVGRESCHTDHIVTTAHVLRGNRPAAGLGAGGRRVGGQAGDGWAGRRETGGRAGGSRAGTQ